MLVSILIPVFNREGMIEACVRSALAQDYKELEVVIVDNCSTDDTWKICQTLAVIDKRLRIFRNCENLGPVKNWLRCLEESKGEYVKFLFSDDLLLSSCVGDMLSKMTSDVGFVFSGVYVGECIENSVIKYQHKAGERFTLKEYISAIAFYRVPVSPGAMLLRRADALNNLKLDFPTKKRHLYQRHGAGPDVMLGLQSLRNGRLAVSCGVVTAFFREHPGSFSTGDQSRMVDASYTSVLAWYLLNEVGFFSWMAFVSLKYSETTRVCRSLINPRKYLLDHEGSGSHVELVGMLFSLPIVVLSRLFYVVHQKYESNFKF